MIDHSVPYTAYFDDSALWRWPQVLSLVPVSLGGGFAASDVQWRLHCSQHCAQILSETTQFEPQIVLSGKLAVITGASRGIGRAVGEALVALGVDVIGTSRNPASVANPPAFPLLSLDIADPASVLAFRGALLGHRRFARHGRVDILVNNAGRFVVGQIIPLPPTDILVLSRRSVISPCARSIPGM